MSLEGLELLVLILLLLLLFSSDDFVVLFDVEFFDNYLLFDVLEDGDLGLFGIDNGVKFFDLEEDFSEEGSEEEEEYDVDIGED